MHGLRRRKQDDEPERAHGVAKRLGYGAAVMLSRDDNM